MAWSTSTPGPGGGLAAFQASVGEVEGARPTGEALGEAHKQTHAF